MKVLGIDPGYGRCGVAVVEKENGKEFLLYSECIETPASADFPERLAQVIGVCTRLLREYEPDCMAIEKLYFTNNQKTAMRVAEVRGALIQCASEAGVAVVEYTPGQIKSATAGHGGADKREVTAMLHLLLKIDKKIKHDDEYDAIAIGITHLAHARAVV